MSRGLVYVIHRALLSNYFDYSMELYNYDFLFKYQLIDNDEDGIAELTKRTGVGTSGVASNCWIEARLILHYLSIEKLNGADFDVKLCY